ncbi:hypothetical protein BST27_08645 [Mycobacterium intermedium]|uniref:DUF3604 domain-containing protein n=1 Tax=Mycobacterium intermedium TaxID=28445 RepID=A0A1E3SAV2_MYCIE|nr:hypothetical protein [Mycobacterium intermedium]MCV6967497.1 hypothetical protein [Mycobacterium intermedium]ODQ99295.1 hypothetical protein BHQ20_17445 [Mycobacterium intermedium]OPE49131.1 hypothetical protein BV508_15250 [Mycobacterium intermedium]ORB07751.1 hypothetical protein BST27_08645 [Mycobacterium intermedium]
MSAEVTLRPLSLPRPPASNDCSVAEVRDKITAELDALPFLGSLACSHAELVAGSLVEVVFTYTVGSSGIADSGWLKLCFRYYSDWDLQTSEPGGRDYATARVLQRSLVGGASTDAAATVQKLAVRYDVKGGERPFQKSLLVHVVDGYLRPGDVLEIRLGDRRFGGPGTRVQTFVEDEFEAHLFVDPLGTSRMAHAAVNKIAIVPGQPEHVVVHGPRVVRGDVSTVRLRTHLQDRWGNVCTGTAATVSAHVDGVPVASTTMPAAGWAQGELTVPATSGRVDVIAKTGTTVLGRGSALIDVLDEFPSPRAYFGDLHVHSNDTVGTQNTDWNLRYGRDIGALDVLGYTANDFQITDEAWVDVVTACREISQDGTFVCFPGVEWCGNAGVGGDHNVVFLGEDTTLARSLEWRQGMASTSPTPQNWPITQLYAAYEKDPESYLLIPHVGGRRAILDWHHPDLERLIEVHSAWGSSPWFLEDALARGLRFGASAASDEHRGRPGGGSPGANIFGGYGGLTGILAPALTSAEVGRGLRARRTWATTGARAVALLRSGDHWMGDEIFSETTDLAASYALYGTAGWEEVLAYDTTGPVWRRDLHAEAGLSRQLVRIRWGGARHRDRYRWATWVGRMSIDGTAVEDMTPWAATHPEQRLELHGAEAEWRTTTYGSDIGLVARLADLGRTRFEIEARVLEDDLTTGFTVNGADLIADGHRDVEVGGLNLRIRLERIAEPAALPSTVKGDLKLHLPPADSAMYLRARQFDGHQVWTSPLFVRRDTRQR